MTTGTGCRCQDCYGLREYLEHSGLNTRGLPAAPGCGSTPTPARLEASCNNTMTCICTACETDRAARQTNARARLQPRQPWETSRAA